MRLMIMIDNDNDSRFAKYAVILNASKCNFDSNELKFLAHLVSADGMRSVGACPINSQVSAAKIIVSIEKLLWHGKLLP